MKYLKIVLIFAVSIILLYFFFKDVNFKEVGKIVQNINPIYPIIFFIGHFFQYFIRAYRWGIILSQYKKKIPLITLFNFTAIGFFLNLLPGRIGEPVRGILLAREEKIDKSYGLASVVIERLIDLLMMILIFLVSLIFLKSQDSPLLLTLKNVSFYVLPFIILIFFMFYFINVPRVFQFIEKIVLFFSKIIPLKLRERVVRFTLHFLKGLKLNLSAIDFLKLFFSSLLVWLYLIGFYWFLMKGFNININFFETIHYFSILIVFAAIPTPGMAGTIDLASKEALMELFDVAKNDAVAFTLLVHVLLLLVWIVLGFVAIQMQGLNFKMLKNIKEKERDEVS
ncbi:MAG: flippase-like domain-containing protein [Candidatus Aminicenantes bacterium]|nr:flippase-like domain-containing protein [Candidatus Aminicenantes bacterium]